MKKDKEFNAILYGWCGGVGMVLCLAGLGKIAEDMTRIMTSCVTSPIGFVNPIGIGYAVIGVILCIPSCVFLIKRENGK